MSSFEAVNEWADVIKFLSMLSKALSHSENVSQIPCDILLSKRLAQCLNPALPVGVHTKALEVYSQIFAIIGCGGLAQNLHLYSFGLFSLFGHASMTVKPQLLSLFEKYFIPLDRDLIPCFKSMIIACLSGLEDESNEYFGQIHALLDSMRSIDVRVFYESFWLSTITAPRHRYPAILYLAKKFRTPSGPEELQLIVGDVPLFLMAINSCLYDFNILAQRTCLDFILSNFKLDQNLLHDDHIILIMESVLAVTLRKDMSLSRRLYTFLMTDDESADNRFAYFSKNGIAPVKKCILNMCRTRTADPVVLTRPYKILMALLDKQNLGIPVVEDIFFDLILALKTQLTCKETPEAVKNELIHTSTMFFSALDPLVLWSNIQHIVQKQVERETAESVTFFLRKIRLVDDETLTLHIPLFIMAVLEICCKNADITVQGIYLECITQIFDSIPSHFIVKASSAAKEIFETAIMTQITTFYENANDNVKFDFDVSHAFARGVYEFCTRLIVEGLKLNRQGSDIEMIKNHMTKIYDLLYKCHGYLDFKRFVFSSDIKSVWVQLLVQFCIDFGHLESLVFLVRSIEFGCMESSVLDSNILPQIVSKIWMKLDSCDSAGQVVASSVLWNLTEICATGVIEDLITGFIANEHLESELAAHFDRFGIFWRVSEQTPEASIYFSKPLFYIIELLRGDLFWKRRLAETFVRCSLKSVSKLMDPLLITLLELSQPVLKQSIIIENTEVLTLQYSSEFDHAAVRHVFALLFDLMQYGGNQLMSSLKNLKIESDSVMKLISVKQLVIAEKDAIGMTYIDLILKLATEYMITEPAENMSFALKADVAALQMNSAGFLQCLVSRSADVDNESITESVQDSCLKKLLWCIEHGQVDLQTKLVSLCFATLKHIVKATAVQNEGSGLFVNVYSASTARSESKHEHGKSPNELLLKVLLKAINSPENHVVLPYYTDFILNSLTVLKSSFRTMIIPLMESIYNQVLHFIDILESSKRNGSANASVDAEVTLLLNTLEKIYLFCYAEVATVEESEFLKKKQIDAYSYGIKGISDFVTGVFVAEATPSSPIERRSSEILIEILVRVSNALCALWRCTEVKTVSGFVSANERIRYRIRRLFDVLVQLFPNETLESLILSWMSSNPALFNIAANFENIDTTVIAIIRSFKAFGPKECISSLISVLRDRMLCSLSKDKARKHLALDSITLSECHILCFMEYYCGMCIDQKALAENFQFMLNLFKEFISHANHFHQTHFSILMALTTIIKNLPPTYGEDKRTKKEMLDVYIKFCELSILIAGRSFDSGSWRRREVGPNNSNETLGANLSSNNELTNSIRSLEQVFGEIKIDENADDKRLAGLPLDITTYFSRTLVPSLRTIVEDHERILSILTNMIYYSINSNLKRRSVNSNIFASLLEQETLNLIVSVSHISFAFKVWRKDAWELFQDAKFFDTRLECLVQWKSILYTIGSNENDRIQDLAGKIITAPIGIFSSKEQEYYSRALSLRKITFMVFSGTKDQYVSSVPVIQEKLVDMLKQPYSTAHAEVYFCLRVLFLKVSPKSLVSIWPVVITEMIKVLIMAIAAKPSEVSTDFLCVLLAACKFLDFLILSANEDYQMFSWIFSTDVGANSKLDEVAYGSLVDKLYILSVGSLSNRSINSTPTFDKEDIDLQMNHSFKAEMVEAKRTLYLDSSLNYKSMKSLSQLNGFFEFAASVTADSILASCKSHYDAFPTPADSIIVGQAGKEAASSTLNDKIIDVVGVERRILTDFLESPQMV